MPKKKRPRWDWRDSGTFSPSNPFDRGHILPDLHDALDQVATILDLPQMDAEHPLVTRLLDATQKYWIYRDTLLDRPRRAEVNAALEDVADKTEALIDCLEHLDDATKGILYFADLKPQSSADSHDHLDDDIAQELEERRAAGLVAPLMDVSPPKTDLSQTLTRVLKDTRRVYASAAKALERAHKDTGGRAKEHTALRLYLADLAAIYQDATGRQPTVTTDPSAIYEVPPYSGQFFTFVESCLMIVDPALIESFQETPHALGNEIKALLRNKKLHK